MLHVGPAGVGVETALPHWLLLFLGVALFGAVVVAGVFASDRLFGIVLSD